jgi:hypothetical protein
MNNYRVTFLHSVNCDYWGTNKKGLQAESYVNFSQLHEKYYRKFVIPIREAAKNLGIHSIWCFYEPFIEITWIATEEQSNALFRDIDNLLMENNITDCHKYTPKDGNFAEWFCNNELERSFGAERYGICAQLVKLFYVYECPIKDGKGKREQVKRTIHGLCNPLGLNYKDEAYICFSRGLICLLFVFFDFKKAVWIYKNIFRQKY